MAQQHSTLVYAVSFLAILFLGKADALAQSENGASYYYVADTKPPDAYLALRTQPSSSYGQRIATMLNGTLLEVLQRRPDGWWFVKVVPSGEQGWALSGQGNRRWIYCCQTVPEISKRTLPE